MSEADIAVNFEARFDPKSAARLDDLIAALREDAESDRATVNAWDVTLPPIAEGD